MAKYRKKLIIIEAIKYKREKNIATIQDFAGDNLEYDPKENEYFLKTLKGNRYLSRDDYIIKGINGEFYLCKPDIFEKTYDAL